MYMILFVSNVLLLIIVGQLTQDCIFCLITTGKFGSLTNILDSLAERGAQLPLDFGFKTSHSFSENRPEDPVGVNCALTLSGVFVSVIIDTSFLTLNMSKL